MGCDLVMNKNNEGYSFKCFRVILFQHGKLTSAAWLFFSKSVEY